MTNSLFVTSFLATLLKCATYTNIVLKFTFTTSEYPNFNKKSTQHRSLSYRSILTRYSYMYKNSHLSA